MNDKQLPQLPTPKFTETIRGVPCITVTEHERLMREYARQAIAKATQPAEVTDDQIAACVKRASTYGQPFVGLLNPGDTPSDFSKRFAAEILALRPVQVPMTDGVREQALDLLATLFDAYENGPACYESPDDCDGYLGNAVQIDHDTFHVIASLLNTHLPTINHGITAHAQKG